MPSEDDPIKRWNYYMAEDALSAVKKPIKYIRENFILPLRQKEKPVYYHQHFDRVPTIDQCELDDPLCRYEAQTQFKRDKMVDTSIIKILRKRITECGTYWGKDAELKCQKEKDEFFENYQNFFIRYGEVSYNMDVLELYMKQKHRMIWLRRRIENGEANADYRD